MFTVQYSIGSSVKEKSGENLTSILADTLMQNVSYIEVFKDGKQLTGKEIRDLIQKNE